MINYIELATGEFNMVPEVFQVLEGWAELYSMADFPEITVTVSWSPALVASVAMAVFTAATRFIL